MSHLTNALVELHSAVDQLRRAANAIADEIERSDNAARQQSVDIAAGLKREKELRDILRSRGLASYDQDERINANVSDVEKNR